PALSSGSALEALRASLAREVPPAPPRPELHVLCRTLAQVTAAAEAGGPHLYADLQDIRECGRAGQIARGAGATIDLATPRIQKPAEAPIFKYLAKHSADGMLVRNLGGLAFCSAQGIPMVADFSLNAANELSVQLLLERGARRVTAAHDLNHEQL